MDRKIAVTAVFAAALALLGAAAAFGGGQRSEDVAVTLREFKIVQPATLPAGPTTFMFQNKGKFEHNYTVVYRSAGATKIATKGIKPGASATLDVNLKPGTYTVLCTIFNGYHASQGMEKQFTVGKIDFKTGTWGA